MDQIILNRYRILRKLGEGAFSEVFAWQDMETNKERAIKIEMKNTNFSLLKYESRMLKKLKGISGIPKFYEYVEW